MHAEADDNASDNSDDEPTTVRIKKESDYSTALNN